LNSEVVDNILIDGNALYENLLRSYRFENGHYFAHDELPDQVSVNFCNLETCVYPDLLFGIVGLGDYENEFLAISLNDAIDTGFGLSEYIICTFNDVTVALFTINNRYYVFDSHSRDVRGNQHPFGSAVLTHPMSQWKRCLQDPLKLFLT